MTCQKELCWYELIPLVSFLALKGKCLNCRSRISIQYPIVELATGIIFAGLFLKFQSIFYSDTLAFSVTYAYYTTMFALLLVIAVYDFRHRIIPNSLSLTFGALAFLGLFFFTVGGFYLHFSTLPGFLSGALLSLLFALIWLVSKGAWMGLGDAKLALGLGWLLGYPLVLSGTVVAFWLGAVTGLALILCSKKYGLKSEVPFVPFLAAGAFIAFLFGLNLFPINF